MRIVSCAAALLTIALLGVAPASAQSRCPANPVRASFSIWPAGTLNNTRHSIARHACGRLLQCIGGYSRFGERRCTWL